MRSNDTPWSGLEVGGVDTRRVDASARWNWFWTVMPGPDVALVLILSDFPDPVPDIPILRNLEIRFQSLSGRSILFIRLKDSAQLELFETFCRDVVATGEFAEVEEEVLARVVKRTFRWHYLLRGGKVEVLSESAQKGLIGEIEVLKLLIASLGPRAALDAWTGPCGAPKDFEFETDCIEVKARRGASKPFVNIANEHQLTDVPEHRLWLGVVTVDKVQSPHGQNLTEYINEVTQLLERTAPATVLTWDLRLAEVGYDVQHDYSSWRWTALPPEFYSITAGFPRITAPVPLGVSEVTYMLALSACIPFRADWRTIQIGLLGGKLTYE